MTSPRSDIPLIDIAPLAGTDSAARQAVARQVGLACRDIGFFAITGHGVAPGQLELAFDAAHRVFDLPQAEKELLSIRRHGHNRGYVALGVEALDEKTAPDLKEAYNLVWDGAPGRPANVWPPLAQWQGPVQAYFDAVLSVGRRLHQAFALDLGLPEDYFAATSPCWPPTAYQVCRCADGTASGSRRPNRPAPSSAISATA